MYVRLTGSLKRTDGFIATDVHRTLGTDPLAVGALHEMRSVLARFAVGVRSAGEAVGQSGRSIVSGYRRSGVAVSEWCVKCFGEIKS